MTKFQPGDILYCASLDLYMLVLRSDLNFVEDWYELYYFDEQSPNKVGRRTVKYCEKYYEKIT